MKFAIAPVKTVNNKTDINLAMMETILAKASKQQVEFVLFSETFLQGKQMDPANALELHSVGIFKLRMLAVNYDVPFGVGFYERVENEIVNSYLVIDTDGQLLVHHRQGSPIQSFKLKDKSFSVVIGEEGFTIEQPSASIVLWPIFISDSPKAWFNTTMDKYRKQCQHLSNDVILVNPHCDDTETPAYGGGFHVNNQQFLLNQPMEQMGLSIFDL